MGKGILLAVVLALAVLACESKSESVPLPSKPAFVPVTVEPAPAEPVPTLSLPASSAEYVGLEIPGTDTMEELYFSAEIIARVQLLSRSKSYRVDNWQEQYAVLEFRFRVLEYVKGTGPNEIVGWITARLTTPEKLEAWHVANHPWDNREAVVFFVGDRSTFPPEQQPADHFLISTAINQGHDGYTVASRYSKNWYPAAAAPSSGARGVADSDPLFMLDAPRSGSSRGGKGARTETGSTIRLSALKQLLADVETEADAGGTEAWRDCVYGHILLKRDLQHRAVKLGAPYESWMLDSIQSGQPAGLVIHTWQFPMTTTTASMSNWLSGEDAPHFALQETEVVVWYPGASMTNPGALSTRQLSTARPIPAGDYEFFVTQAYNSICKTEIQDYQQNLDKAFITVEAPERVLHEFFFDPTTVGTAVGADLENGLLSWDTFPFGGTNVIIDSLKWDGGTVTLELGML